MTTQEHDESNEALSMYSRAQEDSPNADRIVSHTTQSGQEQVDDSEDEATETANTFNSQRRENAIIRKLNAKNARREQENSLRKKVAEWSLWFVLAQLAVTNLTATQKNAKDNHTLCRTFLAKQS
ncbi:hypothetical protein [Bifidobacterium tsurumiense]|uniref:hypothetical protein n=1 Tax=Bifidobacterium tsurumiense TaxID=356829 RepID=UPI0012B306F8|nr:hypothetical protein [Bifidobacterium tsurumiense]MDY4678245.1 hypothetical protein [Bifidobacterium tsurumiense]MSS12151.1 hypothetical protein [Bifidobacterium tsurumiense]